MGGKQTERKGCIQCSFKGEVMINANVPPYWGPCPAHDCPSRPPCTKQPCLACDFPNLAWRAAALPDLPPVPEPRTADQQADGDTEGREVEDVAAQQV